MRHRELWPHFSDGNAITLLENGAEFFPAVESAIEGAQRQIFLETYILEFDDVGRRIVDALCRAAARGVAVHLLVDGFGSREFVDVHLPALKVENLRVLVYRRELRTLAIRRQRLRRMHRKLAVVDGQIAFVGGINIVDDYNTSIPATPRHDYAVRVEGPLLRAIHAAAVHMWEIVSWASLKRRMRVADGLEPPAVASGEMRAAFVIRDNLRHRHDIESAYLAAVERAQFEVVIANAYFLPGRRFRRALVDAAARGVSVTILLQGRIEYLLLHYATQALYPSLLAKGIRIFEYRRSFLHAKVAVIDQDWATVGSSNIDPFSLLLAREGNVIVRDSGFCDDLSRRLARTMGNGANELSVERWEKKSLLARSARWIAYGIVRAAIGLAGYGARHDAT